MKNKKFQLQSKFEPKGDQPKAIERLVDGLNQDFSDQTLLGVTGSGKTFTMANVVERVQKPTLVVAPNKTLAAQLASEFRELFPDNAVHYFVSYYDYYQPEAYVPQTDTYIAKDANINEEIDKLRQAATKALLTREDVLIVASVSCLYGIGKPTDYRSQSLILNKGEYYKREEIFESLVAMQYKRNDTELSRGSFTVKGETVEIYPSYTDSIVRLDWFGDELERIREMDFLTNETKNEMDEIEIFPAKHYVIPKDRLKVIIPQIKRELNEHIQELKSEGKTLEADRIEKRTRYDIEMLQEVGYVSGIENYSRYLSGREPGEPPWTLLDYYPDDFITFIDESHITVPQIGGMYSGNESRKQTLIDHGFRLPSSLDNRPLKFEEFLDKTSQRVHVSATPGDWEKEHSKQVVEQIIRPTGLIDPEIEIKPTEHQIDDLIEEVQHRIENDQRTLVTTLTKKTAEELAEYMADIGLKVHYLHSDIDTVERFERLRDLRLGKVDVIVGINLLREGLDLPEVSLTAILDADKEGFLRSRTSLIQTMGRTARNIDGKVIMYADEITDSMKEAIEETERRREIQMEYNEKNDITPETIKSEIPDSLSEETAEEEQETEEKISEFIDEANKNEVEAQIRHWENEMELAAENLEFEKAADLRDKIQLLKELNSET